MRTPRLDERSCNRLATILTICLWSVIAGAYLVLCWKDGRSINIQVVSTSLVLQCSGVVIGLILIASVLVKRIRFERSGLELYTFIGGLAVLLVSIQGLWKDLFR